MPVVDNAARALITRARRYGPKGSKVGNKNYYKGKGGWKGGFKTKKGRFVKDEYKMVHLQVPDLTDFPLKAYVAKNTLWTPNVPEDHIDIFEELHKKPVKDTPIE